MSPLPSSKASSLRLLVLTPTLCTDGATPSSHPSPFPSFLTKLSGHQPAEHIPSYAGYTSHTPLHLKTKYYEADVSLWCDELPPSSESGQRNPAIPSNPSTKHHEANDTTLSTWQEQMLSSEANEVRQVIGAIVLLLPLTPTVVSSTHNQNHQMSAWLPFIEAVSALRDMVEDETGREVGSVVLLQHEPSPLSQERSGKSTIDNAMQLLEKLEDECLSARGILGWNFVSWTSEPVSTVRASDIVDTPSQEKKPEPKNEFGEKVGFPRVLEVLEGVNWFASSDADDEDVDGFELEDDPIGLDAFSSSEFPRSLTNDQELQQEMMGLKLAMLDSQTSEEAGDGASRSKAQTQSSGRANTTKHDDVWSSLDDQESVGGGGLELQVDQLQSLMERAVAVREAASELPATEREKFARREVATMMKELG